MSLESSIPLRPLIFFNQTLPSTLINWCFIQSTIILTYKIGDLFSLMTIISLIATQRVEDVQASESIYSVG